MFHRFTRGERAAGGGTGLGLAIARWVIDLHGGRILGVDPRHGSPTGVRPASGVPGCRIRVTVPGQS